MHEDWFSPVFKRSESELALEVESKSVELALSVLNERVIGSTVNSDNLHVLEGVERRRLGDSFCFLSQLPIPVSTVAVALILICIARGLLLRMRACYSPTETATMPWPTLIQPPSSRPSRAFPHRVR